MIPTACRPRDEVLEGGEGGLGGVVVAEDAEARGPGRRGESVAQAEPFAGLDAEAQRLQETLDAAEVHMIEVHYLLARLRHDREWLTATAARIRTGDLTWPGSAPAG